VSLMHTCFDLLFILVQVRSYLKFDLTLSEIPSVLVVTSCSLYFYMLYSVLVVSRKHI
jgi:phage gp36-like protein